MIVSLWAGAFIVKNELLSLDYLILQVCYITTAADNIHRVLLKGASLFGAFLNKIEYNLK